MALTYDQILNGLQEIPQIMAQARSRRSRATAELGTANSTVQGLAGSHGPFVTAVSNLAQADPDDAGLQARAAEASRLVTEFGDLSRQTEASVIGVHADVADAIAGALQRGADAAAIRTALIAAADALNQ